MGGYKLSYNWGGTTCCLPQAAGHTVLYVGATEAEARIFGPKMGGIEPWILLMDVWDPIFLGDNVDWTWLNLFGT